MPRIRVKILIQILEDINMKIFKLYDECRNNEVSDKLLVLFNSMNLVLEKLEDVKCVKFVLGTPPDELVEDGGV